MAVRNPFDQIILDDPAYAEETKIDPQAGKKLVRDIYGLVLGEEDPYANKKLERELSVALAQKEAGLPIDPNKSFVTSAERQDPVLGPALDKFKFEPMGLGEFGERALEFLYRDQEKARSKQLRGEELTLGEKIAANPFMAALDAADFTGLLALATKGGIKLSVKGLQTLNNLRSQGASKEVINQVMTSQFPDDAQKIGLVYYQSNRPPGMETSQIMKAPDDGGSGIPKFKDGKYNPAFGLTETFEKQSAAQKDKLKLLEDYYTQNPADKSVSGDQLRVQLQKLLPEGEEAIKPDTLIKYAKANPNTAIGKAFKLKLTKEEQATDDVIKTLREEAELRGETIPINTAAKITGIPGNTMRRLVRDETNGIEEFVAARKPGVTTKNIFHSYFPSRFGESAIDEQTNYTMIFDAFRSGRFGNINNFEKEMAEYGIVPQRIKEGRDMVPNPDYKVGDEAFVAQQKERKQNFINFLINDLFEGEEGYKKLTELVTKRRDLSQYTRTKFPELVMNNEGLKEQFVKEFQEKLSKKYKNKPNEGPSLEELYNNPQTRDEAVQKMALFYAAKNLNGNMAHVMEIGKIKGYSPKKKEEFALGPNLRGKMNNPEFYRINFAAHNIAYQKEFENIIEKSIQKINSLAKGDLSKVRESELKKPIDKIRKVNQRMIDNNMAAYIRLSDVQLSDRAANLLQQVLGEPAIAKEDKGKSIFLGSREDKSLSELQAIFDDRMARYIQDPKSFAISEQMPVGAKIEDEMYITGSAPYIKKGFPRNFEKGGAVKMAKGGLDSVLENMNQQNFTPDPAIDGDSAFQQAVKSGNLTAFNIPKVFKTLGDTFGVFTPKRASAPTATTAEGVDAGTALGAPPGQTLPATKPLQSEDFVFESFTLDKINSPTAPKAAKPQDWINYLQGGKDKAPSAELLDSGLFQYMTDFEKFFPGQKMTKQQIVDLYEQSPIANLKIKVKSMGNAPSPYEDAQEVMGTTRHKNAGNARIDEGGTDYREIVLEAGALPGEQKSFVNSTHFNEDNVLVFSRVANYDNKAGEQVAVIQELQTDLLTKVRKEQERLNAIIENRKAQVERNNNILARPEMNDNFTVQQAGENNTRLTQELNQLEKVKETNLISPYPMTVAKDLIPTYQKQLNDVQQEINTLIRSGIDRSDPEFLMKISELEAQQQKVLDDLLNLNRTSNFDELTKNIRVPETSDSEQLANIAQGRDNYASMKDLETFPPIPFNKQPDYVDLIIKATIKDAEARGINKVAIMPADVGANPRWGKTTLQMDSPDKSSGDKFRNLYDKVGVQQLKNIAKKYGGELNIEEIIDPQKSNLGLTFSTRNIEGDGFNFMKEIDVDQGAISRGDLGPANRFLNEEILRVAQEMGPNEVVYRKETAPGQTMDYFVKIVPDELTGVDNFDLVPLKAGDRPVDARILIEDRDPSAVKMYTITLPEKTKDKPFFLFRKKEGGKIPGDRLVSITDIYGDY